MAATIPVETESGIYSGGRVHPHNGYYAGDFSSARSQFAVTQSSGSPARFIHQADAAA